MINVLVITGPLNSTQLGIPKEAGYRHIHIHSSRENLGSSAMGVAMSNFLKGDNLITRLSKYYNEEINKVGVIWFSAGHGAVKSILKTTKPSDIDAWLCIDGLYGSNVFAKDICLDAVAGKTTLLATASTSTPGQYDHSLDRWRDVVKENNIPDQEKSIAEDIGLPNPDYCWGKSNCLIAGYNNLGHHEQVPQTKKAMLNVWQNIMYPVEPVEPVEPVDPVEPVEPVDPVEPVEPVEPVPTPTPTEQNVGIMIGLMAIGLGLGWFLIKKH